MPENQNKIKGLYKITCVENGKVYVGRAEDIHKRWKTHKRQLNSGNHKNGKLQKDWKEYGESRFKFELLHRWQRGENLADSEEMMIALLKPKYNIVQGKRA